MKKIALFTPALWLGMHSPLMADVLNKVTITGTYTVVSDAVVKTNSSGYTSTQKLVTYKVTNRDILEDLVALSYITSVKGYAIYELVADDSAQNGFYAYNPTTTSVVSIADYLTVTLDSYMISTSETNVSKTNYKKDSFSYQGHTSGTATLSSISLSAYGAYTVKPVTTSAKSDGVTTISDAYFLVNYTLSIRGVTSTASYDWKVKSTPGTHYDGTPDGF